MKATEQFIKDAIEGGWRPEKSSLYEYTYDDLVAYYNHSPKNLLMHAVLDPLAWQAVGKVRGWRKDETKNYPGWQLRMHGLIDALSEGRSIEDYLGLLTLSQ